LLKNRQEKLAGVDARCPFSFARPKENGRKENGAEIPACVRLKADFGGQGNARDGFLTHNPKCVPLRVWNSPNVISQ